MRAGSLSSRITIQQLTAGQDAIGQPVTTWTDVCTVWADIRHQSGSEAIKANAETSIVKASIRIRKRTDITASMRVQHGSIVYQIKAVLQDEQNKDRADLACEMIDG